ncbi:hypothetical protein COOONC_19956 [Cooperia oncophora]
MRFLLLVVLISAASACKLNVKVFTTSPVNVWAQFTFPNETTARRRSEATHLVITGENCGAKPTILRTYKEPPNANVKNIGQTSALIDGGGHLEYQVNGDYSTRMTMRVLVTCGFGDCGRG